MSKHIPHTIKAALEVTRLSEEEAYFLLRFAGQLGYDKAIKRLGGNLFYRFRKWLIWVGGWENPKLLQWDRGFPAWEIFKRGKIQSPTPISLFGNKITFQSRFFQFRILKGIAVIHYPDHLGGWGVYWSPSGTPSHPSAKLFIDQRHYKEQ